MFTWGHLQLIINLIQKPCKELNETEVFFRNVTEGTRNVTEGSRNYEKLKTNSIVFQGKFKSSHFFSL
jgi:hypothetical protein